MPLPREWRHQSLPSPRTPYFPRPPEERKVIRHKAHTLARQSLEEAITELELLDYDFYLLTERATGQDSVLYRTADGDRLAQVRPRPGGPGPVHAAVTVSEHPAPGLTLAAAIARLEALGQPFLFFINSETRRGNLIYHRYDGDYGVITPPAANPVNPGLGLRLHPTIASTGLPWLPAERMVRDSMRPPGRRQDIPRQRAITWGINNGLRGDLPSPALPGSGPGGRRSAFRLSGFSASRRESGFPGQFVRSSSLSRLADTFMLDGVKEAAQGRRPACTGRRSVVVDNGSRYPMDTEAIP